MGLVKQMAKGQTVNPWLGKQKIQDSPYQVLTYF